ncbi:MAG: hypothetical protein OXG72_11115, partial [Acidobacteria bacterium]|nr:hypothetical protein [Acidobacteriota bacterium]
MQLQTRNIPETLGPRFVEGDTKNTGCWADISESNIDDPIRLTEMLEGRAREPGGASRVGRGIRATQ